jgi:hypothetical protein
MLEKVEKEKENEILEKLRKLQKRNRTKDIENNHFEADDLLCDLLNYHGYDEVVKEYNKIFKWYA